MENRLDLSHLEDREVHEVYRAAWDISAGLQCLFKHGFILDDRLDVDMLFESLGAEMKLRHAMRRALRKDQGQG